MWIVFNGEIYNHVELRKELKRAAIASAPTATPRPSSTPTKSGAPTARAACAACSPSPSGTSARSVTLVRDRLGIKPLY